MVALSVSRWLLALPAICILALLLEYVRRNRGAGVAATYVVACAVYGIVRGGLVQAISNSHQVPMPYRMAGSVRIGAVSPMEIAGWLLAAALAWLAGAAIVRFFGSGAGAEPPYRIAIVGSLVLAALSLAVETAAIAAGWWSWSIPPPPEVFLRVPLIALVDWGFVAFDFVLPFLLLTSRASFADRAVALLFFPIHFASHRYLQAPIPAIPISFFELAHFGIPLWVLWRAVGETSAAARTKPEWGFFIPGLAALLVAGDTALVALLAHNGGQAIFILPLAVVGLLALMFGRRRSRPTATTTPSGLTRMLIRAGAVALALGVLLLVTLPANRRRDGYARSFVEGTEKFNNGDNAGAQVLLREAVTLRPDKAEPHFVLALTLYRLDRKDEAAREFAEALRIKPALAEMDSAKLLREALNNR